MNVDTAASHTKDQNFPLQKTTNMFSIGTMNHKINFFVQKYVSCYIAIIYLYLSVSSSIFNVINEIKTQGYSRINFVTRLVLWKTIFFFTDMTLQCFLSHHQSRSVHEQWTWMNRPSGDSSRRIIPVQFWKLMHIFKKNSEINNFKKIFCSFYNFFEFLKNFVIRFNHEKATKEPK